MPTNFPTSLDTLTNPTSGDAMNSVTVPHADQHANANDALEALEAKVGVDNSAVSSSLDYITKAASSMDPGHRHSKLFSTTGVEAVNINASAQVNVATINASNIVAASGTISGGRVWQLNSNSIVASSVAASTISVTGLHFGGAANVYLGAADTLQIPGSLRLDTRMGIGGAVGTTTQLEIAKTTSVSWLGTRNTMTMNTPVTGGQVIQAAQNLCYINANIGSGPSNFVTAEQVATYIQAGTAYVHYAVGGEFSTRALVGQTGGTINLMAGGLFQAWLQGTYGSTLSTVMGGRFDCLCVDNTTSGTVTLGSAAHLRFGSLLASGGTTWTTINGLYLEAFGAGRGVATNWYGINSAAVTNPGTVTLAKWVNLSSLMAVTANNQTRVGLDISAMPASGAFTGTLITAIRLASGTVEDGISWGNRVNLYASTASALKTDGEMVVGRRFTSSVVTIASGASARTDATLGNHFRLTLGGNSLLMNPTGAVDGQKITWEVTQDISGSRLLTYDTKFGFGADITSATLSTSGFKKDFITSIYNSVTDKFYIVGFVKGY